MVRPDQGHHPQVLFIIAQVNRIQVNPLAEDDFRQLPGNIRHSVSKFAVYHHAGVRRPIRSNRPSIGTGNCPTAGSDPALAPTSIRSKRHSVRIQRDRSKGGHQVRTPPYLVGLYPPGSHEFPHLSPVSGRRIARTIPRKSVGGRFSLRYKRVMTRQAVALMVVEQTFHRREEQVRYGLADHALSRRARAAEGSSAIAKDSVSYVGDITFRPGRLLNIPPARTRGTARPEPRQLSARPESNPLQPPASLVSVYLVGRSSALPCGDAAVYH